LPATDQRPVKASDFYERLPSFSDFREFTRDRHFVRAPDDWFVVITDVKGSTRAIEAGRYKDVNTIGAASISVVNGLLGSDFPFVFGGDGATLLVPPEVIDRVLDGLMRLQRLSREQFQIELRVGRIRVAEVHQAGAVIEVAKHELTAGRCVAVFRGGGLNEAERRIKGEEAKYCVQADAAGELELTGLSCRWNPLPNQRGRIMALLVCAKTGPAAGVYDALLARLNEIYGGQLEEANPVNTGLMRYSSIAECVKEETRFHTRKPAWAFFKRILEIVAAVLIFKYRLPPLIFNAAHYRDAMRLHADHRKFDDMLRMILDCSEEQVAAIRAHLEERKAAGELCYGIHLSDTALMTCYVQDVKDGQHIHFIDGGDGGYAMAAKQLKRQLKEE
jgi:hypothetical protein